VRRRSYYLSSSEKKMLLFSTHEEETNVFVPVGRRTCCFSGNVIMKLLFSMQCEEEVIVFCRSEKKKLLFLKQ
jgi:hypothetical protein